MANTKERLDNVETTLGMVQDELQKMSVGITDKFHSMEASFNNTLADSMNRLFEMMNHNREEGAQVSRGQHQTDGIHLDVQRGDNTNPVAQGHVQHGDNTNPVAQGHVQPLRRNVKLELPRFYGGDPTEWVSKAKQYFAYYEIPVDRRVSFASYHLSEEANEWWQAISKARRLDPSQTNWEVFETELWTRFGPMDGENFDEALSHIQQKGSLIEYQREFERLQNKVEGWTEKALVGTFMGGLNTSISSGIRLFKPKTLTEIINLARLRDDQLQLEKKWASPRGSNVNSQQPINNNSSPQPSHAQAPKKLSWEELKTKRSLGLCFSCDERYMPGHKCKQPQLFIMEAEHEEDNEVNLEDKVLFEEGSIDESANKANYGKLISTRNSK